MSDSFYIHKPTDADYYPAGARVENTFAHWISITKDYAVDVKIQVTSAGFARILETAARQCAEALEQEAREEALSAQGTPTDHLSEPGRNKPEAAE